MNDGWMDVCLDGWMDRWIQTQMCRPEHDFEHIYTEFRREFTDLNIMDALKSRCKGIGAHKNGFFTAMLLESYVLLHYFEGARRLTGWILAI